MADVTELSRDAYERLQSEYDDLTGRGRIEIARKIEVARELGDLSENGDYQAAKEEQGRMEGRIARLATILRNHKIIDPSADDGRVSVGVVVELRYDGDTETERFLVGSIEERKDGVTVVSPTSPLGEALVGSAVGDVVDFEAPGGELRVEVVSIEA
ncbi:MAG: transcription elongation factor GreA [Acidimicrobiia bacterium]|nr:transcription elongation factor GreA [Acidimicrobiia bacterium]